MAPPQASRKQALRKTIAARDQPAARHEYGAYNGFPPERQEEFGEREIWRVKFGVRHTGKPPPPPRRDSLWRPLAIPVAGRYSRVMLPSRYWIDLATTDFRARDVSGAIAVLPVAAVEQHGPHLPLGVDAMIMQGAIERVVERLPDDLDALFLPIQSVGVSIEHRDFPGTLSLSHETALRVLTEIADGVVRTGVRKLVLLNSHGGNSPLVSQAALELRARHGVLAVTCSWSRFGYPDGLFCETELRHGIHGGEIETSLMLAFRPELVDMTRARDFKPASLEFERDFTWLRADRPAGFGWMAQDLSAAGAMGDASRASADKGEAAADYWATAFIELLRDVEAFDLARLAARD